jgi:hypothetical protein
MRNDAWSAEAARVAHRRVPDRRRPLPTRRCRGRPPRPAPARSRTRHRRRDPGWRLIGTSVEVQGTRFGATTGRRRPLPDHRRSGGVPGRDRATHRARIVPADGASWPPTRRSPPTSTLDVLGLLPRRGRRHGNRRRRATPHAGQLRGLHRRPSRRWSAAAAPDLAALLSSRTPGAIIYGPGSGRIGAGPTIQIRGRSTLSLSSEPIVYVDGVRVNNAPNQGPQADSWAPRTRESPTAQRHQSRGHREHRGHSRTGRLHDLRDRSGQRRHPGDHEEGAERCGPLDCLPRGRSPQRYG